MFFSSQNPADLPTVGDLVETPDGPMTVGGIQVDTAGGRWLVSQDGFHSYRVEVVARGIEVGALARVDVPTYYAMVKARMASVIGDTATYGRWAERLADIDTVGGWVWGDVRVLSLGEMCRVEDKFGVVRSLPRACLRGRAQ